MEQLAAPQIATTDRPPNKSWFSFVDKSTQGSTPRYKAGSNDQAITSVTDRSHPATFYCMRGDPHRTLCSGTRDHSIVHHMLQTHKLHSGAFEIHYPNWETAKLALRTIDQLSSQLVAVYVTLILYCNPSDNKTRQDMFHTELGPWGFIQHLHSPALHWQLLHRQRADQDD